MEAKLVVVGGKANMGEIKLRLPMTIGRGNKADLIISHPTVSRIHCKLSEVDGLLAVRDNSSSNGTFIDGKQISEAVLRPGQQLKIGPITFRAEYDLPELIPAAPPSDAGSGLAETQTIAKDEFNFLVDDLLEKPSEEKTEAAPPKAAVKPAKTRGPSVPEGKATAAPSPAKPTAPAVLPQASEETAVFEQSPSAMFEETNPGAEAESMFEDIAEASPPNAVEPPANEEKSASAAAMDFDFLSELNLDEPAAEEPPAASPPPEASAVAPAAEDNEPTAEAKQPVAPDESSSPFVAAPLEKPIADEPEAPPESAPIDEFAMIEKSAEKSAVDEVTDAPSTPDESANVANTISTEALDWNFDLEEPSSPAEPTAATVEVTSSSPAEESSLGDEPKWDFEPESQPAAEPPAAEPPAAAAESEAVAAELPPAFEPASEIEPAPAAENVAAAASEEAVFDFADFSEPPASSPSSSEERPVNEQPTVSEADLPEPTDLPEPIGPFAFDNDSAVAETQQFVAPTLPEPESSPFSFTSPAASPPSPAPGSFEQPEAYPAPVAKASAPVRPAGPPPLSLIDKIKKLLGLGAKKSKPVVARKTISGAGAVGSSELSHLESVAAVATMPIAVPKPVASPLDAPIPLAEDAPIPLFGDEPIAATTDTPPPVEEQIPFDFGSSIPLDDPEAAAPPSDTPPAAEAASLLDAPVLDAPVLDAPERTNAPPAAEASAPSDMPESESVNPSVEPSGAAEVETPNDLFAFEDLVAEVPSSPTPAEPPQETPAATPEVDFFAAIDDAETPPHDQSLETPSAAEPEPNDLFASFAEPELPPSPPPAETPAPQGEAAAESETADPWASFAEPVAPAAAPVADLPPATDPAPAAAAEDEDPFAALAPAETSVESPVAESADESAGAAVPEPSEPAPVDLFASFAEPIASAPEPAAETPPPAEAIAAESDQNDLFAALTDPAPLVDEPVPPSPTDEIAAEGEIAEPLFPGFSESETPANPEAATAETEAELLAETKPSPPVAEPDVDALFDSLATSAEAEPAAAASAPMAEEEAAAMPFAFDEAADAPTSLPDEEPQEVLAGVGAGDEAAELGGAAEVAIGAIPIGQRATRPYWIDADVHLKVSTSVRLVTKVLPISIPMMEPDMPAGRVFNRVGKQAVSPIETVAPAESIADVPAAEGVADIFAADESAAEVMSELQPEEPVIESPIVADADAEGLLPFEDGTEQPNETSPSVVDAAEAALEVESLFAEVSATGPAAPADGSEYVEGLTELFSPAVEEAAPSPDISAASVEPTVDVSESSDQTPPSEGVAEKKSTEPAKPKPAANDADLDEFFKELGMG